LKAGDLEGIKIKYIQQQNTTEKFSKLAEFTREITREETDSVGNGRERVTSERFIIQKTDPHGATAPVSLVLPSESTLKLANCFDEIWTVGLAVDAPVSNADVLLDETAFEAAAKRTPAVAQPPNLQDRRQSLKRTTSAHLLEAFKKPKKSK